MSSHAKPNRARQGARHRLPTDSHQTVTTTNAAVPALAIKYECTEDLADGSPWPPDGDGYWAIVGRIRGHGLTLWRHVGITNTTTREERIAND